MRWSGRITCGPKSKPFFANEFGMRRPIYRRDLNDSTVDSVCSSMTKMKYSHAPLYSRISDTTPRCIRLPVSKCKQSPTEKSLVLTFEYFFRARGVRLGTEICFSNRPRITRLSFAKVESPAFSQRAKLLPL